VEDKKVKLNEALDTLEECVTDTLVFFEKLDPTNLTLMLQAFDRLGQAYDRLNTTTKLLGELYDKYSYEVIPTAFETMGIDALKTAGRNFILSTRLNASIPENMRDAGNKWVAEIAKCPELIIPRINPKQLSSLVKAYFEAHAELPPEDAVKVHQQKYIQVRKA
jgi:hypothetical protein